MSPVSKYFRHTTSVVEQSLLNDLTRETIFQRGIDLWYIPRTNSDIGWDYLFGEDPENIFDTAIELEMYCENVSSGFEGADAVGRFALEIMDMATFQIARSRFTDEVTKVYPEIVRPREGDLIIFRASEMENMVIFEITFGEKELPFYQLGKTNVFRVETERMKYSHETMSTGIDELDAPDFSVVQETKDNPDLQTESDTFVDFNESDPFSEGDY